MKQNNDKVNVQIQNKGAEMTIYRDMLSLRGPNPLVFMRCNYTKLQLQTVVVIMEKLQELLNKSYEYYYKYNTQMPIDFVLNTDDGKLRFDVEYEKMNLDRRRYEELKDSLLEMATIPIELLYTRPNGREYIVFQSLCKVKIEKYSRYFTLEIEKDVAEILLNIGQGFTRFLKEVAVNFDSKYTLRMYLLISAFKNTGFFELTLSQLRKMLRLTTKYQRYDNFYAKVIKPAYEELYQKADCWFEVEAVDYKENGEPKKLRFRVIRAQGALSAGEVDVLNANRDKIRELCRRYFGMTDKHFDDIRNSITVNNYDRVYDKILNLITYCRENRRSIRSVTDYAYMALKNELQNERNIK